MLGGLTEMGPFRPTADGKLEDNPHTWNEKVSMIFIEQPCGVGFSYSTAGDADLETGDDQAALDNYALIQAFLVRFPQFSKNKMYLTSESYGGHYLPTLAKVIVDKNTAGLDPKLNFGGFAVGNPATTHDSTTPAMMQTYWGHQLLPKPLWDKYTKLCVEAIRPNAQDCETLFLEIFAKTSAYNPYALDFPVCLADSRVGSTPHPAMYGRGQRLHLLRNRLQGLQPASKAALGLDAVMSDAYVPCEDDYMTSYLNRADVKAALHVKADITWGDCSRTIRYNQLDGAKSMLPYYTYLLNGSFDIDILVYSGDDDSVCGTVGTQEWIWGLGYVPRVGSDWVGWTDPSGQTAGYLTRFAGVRFAFATVHGAGHEVPTYKPQAAKVLFDNFIAGTWTKNI